MKDRITLGLLIILMWVMLVILQKYLPLDISTLIILAVMGLYTLLINAATYHQKRKTKKNPQKLNNDYKPFVSILIPCHNEECVIEDTVINMVSIDYPSYEIIIIDDRSTDSTAKVLEELSLKYSDKLKFIVRDKASFPGKSAVLNEAMSKTSGEVICVFDADARVEPDFLTKIVPFLAEKEIGAVQARKVISNKTYNFLTRCQENEYVLDCHFQRGRDCIRGAVELRGNGQLIKKEALEDIGGWNNYTITDDLDLSTRLHLKKWDIRFCHEVKVFEEGVIDFLALLRQRRRWVEGSIRRYLDYFLDVLLSKNISHRVRADMTAYLCEFILPLWMLSELCLHGIKFIRGYEHNLLSSIAVIPLVFMFFISGLVYSIRRYNAVSFYNSIIQAIETGVYMVLIWTPIVFFIIFKIIFMKRTMDWGKTQHGLVAESIGQEECIKYN